MAGRGSGEPSVRVLTVNAGSTSLKLERYALNAPLPPIGEPPDPQASFVAAPESAAGALAEALNDGVDVVAHRIVRLPDGAPPVVPLDEAQTGAITGASAEAPLHNARALAVAAQIRRLRPDLVQLGVSDAAFHRSIPAAAATYGIPATLSRAGLRRIGYHGLSHEYAAHRVAALAGVKIDDARIVTIHLGGGSSLCAVRGGASLDTTMGYTPLEGVPMATRSGSVDPGLLIHLLRGGMSLDELEEMLERRSGLLGISARSGDMRELLAAQATDPGARLALDVLEWRLRGALGAMIAVLGGVDLIAFTGGIGEHVPRVRAAALAGTSAWGGAAEDARNDALAGEGRISPDAARVHAYAIRARENWQLARAAFSEASSGSA